MPNKKSKAAETSQEESQTPKKESARARYIRKDRDTFAALEVMASSEGGKILVDNLTKDIVSSMDSLANGYRKLPHAELVALCADLDNKLSILRLITRAKKNKDLADIALKEALLEVPEDEG